jgi:hypothetical protein
MSVSAIFDWLGLWTKLPAAGDGISKEDTGLGASKDDTGAGKVFSSSDGITGAGTPGRPDSPEALNSAGRPVPVEIAF